jgi:hypothetical protein
MVASTIHVTRRVFVGQRGVLGDEGEASGVAFENERGRFCHVGCDGRER